MRVMSKDRFQVEDRRDWDEQTRTPEIKAYSAATRQLIRRSVPLRLLSLATGGYVIWVIIYVFGIAGVGPVANDHERQVAIFVSIGWIAIICFFVIPVVAMIYRGRLFRVSVKHKTPSSNGS